MNYLKVNLVIGIDYLFNGNSSNPDFQKTSPIMRISDNKAIEKHMNSTTKVNAKLNNATHISGPHRNQSVDQSGILKYYEKDKNGSLGLKKNSLSQSQGKRMVNL